MGKRYGLIMTVCGAVAVLLVTVPCTCFAQVATAKSTAKVREVSQNLRLKRVVWRGSAAMTKAPEYEFRGIARSSGKSPEDWAIISVLYDTFPKWADQIVVKYHVLLFRGNRDKSEKGGGNKDNPVSDYTMLEGIVTYVDVREGNSHMSTMYMRPSTLARYGELVAIGVEINYEDENVVYCEFGASVPLTAEAKSSGRWWEFVKNSDKVSVKTDLLLNRSQTPFILANYGDEESIRL